MSVFDKLKAYSRKPAAVILATVMATSTIPTTPIAQAVTAAYAAESTTPAKTKGTEKAETKNVTPADLGINDIDNWNGNDQTVTYSVHIDKGTPNVTIKADTIAKLIDEQVRAQAGDQFKYDPNAQTGVSKVVNDELAGITLPDGCKDKAVSKDKNGEYLVTTSLDTKSLAYTVSPAVGVTQNKDNSVTVVGNAGGEVQLTFTVTKLNYNVSFSYGYEKPQEKKDPEPGKGDTSDTAKKDDSADTSNGAKGTSEEETTTPTTPVIPAATEHVDVEKPVNCKPQFAPDYSKVVFQTPGKLKFVEYYSNLDPSTFAEVDATNLVYKTPQSAYSLSLGKQGFTGKFENDKSTYSCDEFDAELTTVSGEETQLIKIKPKKHFDGTDIKINWYYPNGDIVDGATTTVHVKIAKKTINLFQIGTALNSEVRAEYLDFRQANDKLQDKALKDSLNEAVAELVKKATTSDEFEADEIKNYFDSAKIAKDDTTLGMYYSNAEAGQMTRLTGSNLVLDPADENELPILSNYEFVGESGISIMVKAMESGDWTKPRDPNEKSLVRKLSISGKGLSDETFKSPSETWIHEKGTYAWEGGTIALASQEALSNDTKFAASYQDPTAINEVIDGVQDASFYVKDTKGVVRKITGTTYKLDHVAPKLVSFEATPKDAKRIKQKGKTKDLSVLVAKNMGVKFVTSEGEETAMSSGMNDVHVTYKEQGSKTAETPGNFERKNGGRTYSFDISADSKVSVDSFNIDLMDNAGNSNPNQKYNSGDTPIDVAELMAETTEPTISATWDTSAASHGKYYNTNRTLTLTVDAPFFDYVQEYMPEHVMATITKNGSAWKAVKPGNFTRIDGTDKWVATVSFTEDGDYEVSGINVKDLLDRGPKLDGESFTIDKTAPKLNVSWNTEAAQNGKYYNAARTATITVEEHNFDPNLFKIEAPVSAGNGDEATPAQIGGWSSNGDTHTATVTFPGQGVYTLSVSGEDLASNKSESYTSPEFVIDTIKPKIDIQNVVNRTAYAGEVAPTAAVHDTNLADGTSIEVSKISYPLSKDDPNPYAGAAINTSATDKSVSYLNPAKTKGNDGVYTLTVQAVDLAGNTESEAVTWSVNRFGSTYVISDNTGKMLDQYLKSAKTTDVKVTEINPSGLDDNKTSVELTRDTKNTTLKSGDNYTTDADTTSGWSEYNYTVSKSNYDKDGAYRVLFHSEDAAGNSSENTMEGKNAKKSGAAAEINFAVDDTAPIASFVDLASNGKYEESSHKAKVSFEDNLKLSKAQIKVNGKTVATFTADQLEKSPIREFTLDGSSSKQDVTVVAWDAAGNKSKELKATGVLVTNDSFVLWMNNLPLMVGTIVAIVVVAGGIYLVVAKKRKENEEK